MPVPEEWRPGSFTKNFSWGRDGLRELHTIIRTGFSEEMRDVPRALFRDRVKRSGRPDYIPINFFLFNKIEGGESIIVADELVYQALNFDHSADFDKLSLFAFNFSYVGTWKGGEPYQRRPALWAHHYVADRVSKEFNWNARRVNADDIERFVSSSPLYRAKTARKLATNLNYLYQIGRLGELDTGKVQRWWVAALFLAMDRLIEDRAARKQASPTKDWMTLLDLSNFHFITGRRSVERDLATRHLLKLYEACGARERFSEEHARERQKILLPDIQYFANSNDPLDALHPSNPALVKTIPRACAMLARYAGFITLELDQMAELDVGAFVRNFTKQALDKLREQGVSPTLTAEELMKLTRER
jgi:hypothetical protein